jgi:hypothetical protein
MTDPLTVLDRYQQLVNTHSEQFDPLVQQLYQLVEAELREIRQQESSLVQTQTEVLKALQAEMAIDIRFLLTNRGFQSFFADLPKKSFHNYHSGRKTQVADQISAWVLHQSAQPLRVFDYQTRVDPDDYDDERSYVSYHYSVKVAWGETSVETIHVNTENIYGVNNRRAYALTDQIGDIHDGLWEFFDRKVITDNESQMVAEMSYLVAYAASLLALQPQTVKFTYDSAVVVE